MTRATGDAGSGCTTQEDRRRRFGVRAGRFGTIDGVRLSDSHDGTWALFAKRGATLIDWVVPFGGGLLSLTDGYRSKTELYAQNGVRNGVMVPFPNRIAGARYHFGHRDHDLLPGVPEAERLIYHGFLRNLDLALVDTRAGEDGAEALFSTDAIRPGAFPGYPFALTVHVRVRLGPEGLSLTITATNTGHLTAPYAAGWHPYFRLGDGSIDTLELQVPAQACIVTDASLLPLSGSAAYAAIETRPELDFRTPRALGATMIDAALASVQPDADGMIRTRLRDPRRGCGLSVWQEGGLVHLFTGDTLARGARRSIAIEPVEVMTDAFNRSDCHTAIGLEPGASRSFRCGAQFRAQMEMR
ncbi:MAG: aldose 1-epimerase [Azoarcus sp.]|nr:aldose 1-epimerase [Azoarcus sp.]